MLRGVCWAVGASALSYCLCLMLLLTLAAHCSTSFCAFGRPGLAQQVVVWIAGVGAGLSVLGCWRFTYMILPVTGVVIHLSCTLQHIILCIWQSHGLHVALRA